MATVCSHGAQYCHSLRIPRWTSWDTSIRPMGRGGLGKATECSPCPLLLSVHRLCERGTPCSVSSLQSCNATRLDDLLRSN